MIQPWVRELTEGVFGPAPWKVGDRVRHKDGRLVQITSGRYWGAHGLSNFWYWKPVLLDGVTLGPEEHGYGWQ